MVQETEILVNSELLNEIDTIEEKVSVIEKKQHAEWVEIEYKHFQERKKLYDNRDALFKKIPNFWFEVIQAHRISGLVASEEDAQALFYLDGIKVIRPSVNQVKVVFEFRENPFFSNSELTKEMTIDEENEEEAAKMVNSEIDWKKNLLENVDDDNLSFFSIFTEDYFEIVELISDDLYPNAYKYFNGEMEGSEGDYDHECEDGCEHSLEELEE